MQRKTLPPPPKDPQLKCDAGGLFFQWRAVKGAKHYRYRLVADSQRRVNDRTKKTSVDLGAGEPGQTYTAKVRVKRKDGLSKWANVTAKCPAAAPIPDPSVEFTINHIYGDSAHLEWSWKHLPASTRRVVILMRPKVKDGLCGWLHSGEFSLPSEGEHAEKFYPLCSDTDYYWAFAIEDTSGEIKFLKEEYFRTPPYTDQNCWLCYGPY